MDGCTITDDDRRDRLFSVIFSGSGTGGSWTAGDWAFYQDQKEKLWKGTLSWLFDVPMGLDRFLSHLDRLASHYNPGEEAAFVKAVGNVWGGIPFGPSITSAIQVRRGPALPFLHEGDDNWIGALNDDGQPAHHYAGLFYAGFFFGADHAAAANWLRDGPISDNNPPDLHLGYVAGLQGDLLWGRFLSVSQVSTAARYALDARLTTWPESPKPWDYLFYWSIPYGRR